MKLYNQNDNYKLYQGNMLDMLEVIEPNSIDSIITDPPYELNFMNKDWDNSGIAFQKETWEKCYEVLKPGGYLLAFGGSRTFHRIAVAIEDAGFEIRDTIMWLYGSGFPKSLNIGLALDKKNGVEREIIGYKNYGDKSKEGYNPYHATKETQNKGFILPTNKPAITKGNSKWEGWGTALKPSFEPIIVARKPFKGSLVDNVIEYGVGGINIDECRVETQDDLYRKPCENGSIYSQQEKHYTTGTMNDSYKLGRFPANTILTYDDTDFDEVCGGFPNTYGSFRVGIRDSKGAMFDFGRKKDPLRGYTDSDSASRYFYCAKASKKDRDEGLDEFEERPSQLNSGGIGRKCSVEKRLNNNGENTPTMKNIHPTVKPTELMQYLVRLVSPDGATILDPFNGSGSTGKAVMYENREKNKNYKYIGIELTEEYLPISKARIEYVCNLPEEKDMQMTIFDFIGD